MLTDAVVESPLSGRTVMLSDLSTGSTGKFDCEFPAADYERAIRQSSLRQVEKRTFEDQRS
ncbi:UNVERIFIED_CONTAM: hypothetical protein HHA_453510 [Hammondia hammondi]|eukprot:XP_008886746.1 hypothetical protein HHA_453510 [Hammondia hammondi]